MKQTSKVSLLGVNANPPIDILSALAEKKANGDTAANIVKLQYKGRSAMASGHKGARSPGAALVELDNLVFSDLSSAYESLINGIVPLEDLIAEKEKNKEKRKGTSQEVDPKGLISFLCFMLLLDPEFDYPAVYKTIMENCEQAVRWRLERLNTNACNTLRVFTSFRPIQHFIYIGIQN
jgi:hypothetical protein